MRAGDFPTIPHDNYILNIDYKQDGKHTHTYIYIYICAVYITYMYMYMHIRCEVNEVFLDRRMTILHFFCIFCQF